MANPPIGLSATKSRRDETLLTVDFNLRARKATYSPQVPQGRYCRRQYVVPAGLEAQFSIFMSVGYATLHLRLIKCCPMRDISPMIKYECVKVELRYAIYFV